MIGGIVGGIVGLVVIIALVWFCLRKRNTAQKHQSDAAELESKAPVAEKYSQNHTDEPVHYSELESKPAIVEAETHALVEADGSAERRAELA